MKTYLVAAALIAGTIGAASQALADEGVTADNDYKRMTVTEFLLDGKTLVGQEVSLIGTYIHEGETDWLYSANTPVRNRDETNGAPLLIQDGATREFRLFLMNAWNQTNIERGIHGVVVLGRVSMCERTTLVTTKQMPCIIVDDGRTPTQEAARQYEADRPAREEATRQYEADRPAREAIEAREAAAAQAARRAERVRLYNECMSENASLNTEANNPMHLPRNDDGRTACEGYANAHMGFVIGTAFQH